MNVKNSFMAAWVSLGVLGLALSFFSACATSPIKRTSQMNQKIKSIALSTVQFYRPDFAPADHDEFDHQDKSLKCESPESLWQDLLKSANTVERLNCLNSLGRVQAHYRYVAEAKPFLELMSDVSAAEPECLARVLKVIPLPREIYFLGSTEAKGEEKTNSSDFNCYSAGFDTRVNHFLDAKLRNPQSYVQFNFPLARKLNNENDLQLWLLISLFGILNQGPGQDPNSFWIQASWVPHSTCSKCFMNDALFNDKMKHKLDAIEWP